MEEHPSFSGKQQDEGINFREQLDIYLKHYKWFLLSIFLCLIAAIVFLRYTIPEYSATAMILVRDERKGGLESELSAFSDLGLMKGVKNNVDNEVEIIKSRTIIEKAVKKLGFTVSYYTQGRVKTLERYKDSPFNCFFFDCDSLFYLKNKKYTLKSYNNNNFEIYNANNVKIGDFQFGKKIVFDNFKLIVNKNNFKLKPTDVNKSSEVIITINNIKSVVQNYKSRLTIAPVGKNTSVVELNLNDPIKEKAQDLLNEIIKIYNQDAIDDKNFISKKTQEFINERIKLITNELGEVEKNQESYKKENKFIDLPTESGLYLQNSVDFQKQLIETETQIKIVNDLINYINNQPPGELLPSNIIPSDENASDLITEYNDVVVLRNRIANEGTPKSSIIKNYNNKISELNQSIKESLKRLNISLNIKKSDLEKQLGQLGNRLSLIPGQTRELRNIDRQQGIKEALYLYLLQKREETAIALAGTAPNAKVIDSAEYSIIPVSPKRNMFFLAALVLGLLIPFIIIYLMELLDTKIKTRQDIEGKISIPFLGDVPRSSSSDEIINTNSRSSSAEAIRIVRTNIEFLLGQVPQGLAKTIFITSTLPKEGKTFISINLANAIALSGKKVLLMGLDIRNPKIDKYIKLPSKGITNYLSKTNEDINKYIVQLENSKNLFILPSGTIPPNPVELLMNNKIDDLFKELKQQFDYIIVDTAPVSVVTDTLLIAKNADSFIYVMRANYLDKRMVRLAETFYKEKKLPNMSILLNDTIWNKRYGYGYSYGYSYGYGYGDEITKKTWWSSFFKKNFND